MVAFSLSKPISLSRGTGSFVSNHRLHQSVARGQLRNKSFTPLCQVSLPANKFTRRTIVALLAASAISPVLQNVRAERLKIEPYDANKSRRYLPEGRPLPDRSIPKFASDITVFNIDEQLTAQDLKTGSGGSVGKGTLVMARWLAVLADGTVVDDTNETQPALFRPGAHQVPPGIEDAVVGMSEGGVRRVSGSSERILSNIAVGNNIGERSLVPTGTRMYVDVFVDRINPYGTRRVIATNHAHVAFVELKMGSPSFMTRTLTVDG